PEVDVTGGGAHLGEADLVALPQQAHAEHVAVPGDRAVEVAHLQDAGQMAGERGTLRRRGLRGRRCAGGVLRGGGAGEHERDQATEEGSHGWCSGRAGNGPAVLARAAGTRGAHRFLRPAPPAGAVHRQIFTSGTSSTPKRSRTRSCTAATSARKSRHVPPPSLTKWSAGLAETSIRPTPINLHPASSISFAAGAHAGVRNTQPSPNSDARGEAVRRSRSASGRP